MSPEHYFNDKSAILLHPGTRWNKNFASQRQNYAQKIQDAQVTKSLVRSLIGVSFLEAIQIPEFINIAHAMVEFWK